MLACYWNIEAVSQSIYSLLEINKKKICTESHIWHIIPGVWYISIFCLLWNIKLARGLKARLINGFFGMLLCLWCSLVPASSGPALLCFIWPFTEVCSKTWRASGIKPPGRREYRNIFFFIRRVQSKEKILKLKWGNSTNYRLSQSNPVTIAKNMKRCKHGNKLLIWM